jgi:uncharacterized protein YxeA
MTLSWTKLSPKYKIFLIIILSNALLYIIYSIYIFNKEECDNSENIYLNQTSLNTFKKTLKWVTSLRRFEKKVYSQNGEDGIIEEIFNRIGTTNKYYVEFGTESGTETNTRYLKDKKSWTGLLMDGSHENKDINLHKEMISPMNIISLLKKYNVPEEPDLISVDTDMYDYWIAKEILTEYRPRVIIVEFNSLLKECDTVDISYINEFPFWNGYDGGYFGSSLCALYQLMAKNQYSLVFVDTQGINTFFIRDEVVGLPLYEYIDWPVYLTGPRYNGGNGWGRSKTDLSYYRVKEEY